jgi:hypothetical protein
MIQEIRFGVRMFIENRVFTFAVVLCFALGIGANISIFSVVNSLILRPLPFENPEGMVVIGNMMPDGFDPNLATAEYLELREWNRSFKEMAGHTQLNTW